MAPTLKDIIDELNKAITNHQKYSKELINLFNEKRNNIYLEIGELLKCKTARKLIEINNMVLKMIDEIISEII